jgi:hypothetical protein
VPTEEHTLVSVLVSDVNTFSLQSNPHSTAKATLVPPKDSISRNRTTNTKVPPVLPGANYLVGEYNDALYHRIIETVSGRLGIHFVKEDKYTDAWHCPLAAMEVVLVPLRTGSGTIAVLRSSG